MTGNKSGKQTLLIEACFISVKDILTTILGQKLKKKVSTWVFVCCEKDCGP